MTEDQERKVWWQTVPGILTGIAGIITALTGFIVGLYQVGILGNANRTPPLPKNNLAATADVIAGKWSGKATEGGASFPVDIEIKKSCVLGEKCGVISVPHVPCRGELFLFKIEKDDYEFRVDNFATGSSASCTPGAGEHFTRLPEGTLLYTTTYGSGARGILHKVED